MGQIVPYESGRERKENPVDSFIVVDSNTVTPFDCTQIVLPIELFTSYPNQAEQSYFFLIQKNHTVRTSNSQILLNNQYTSRNRGIGFLLSHYQITIYIRRDLASTYTFPTATYDSGSVTNVDTIISIGITFRFSADTMYARLYVNKRLLLEQVIDTVANSVKLDTDNMFFFSATTPTYWHGSFGSANSQYTISNIIKFNKELTSRDIEFLHTYGGKIIPTNLHAFTQQYFFSTPSNFRTKTVSGGNDIVVNSSANQITQIVADQVVNADEEAVLEFTIPSISSDNTGTFVGICNSNTPSVGIAFQITNNASAPTTNGALQHALLLKTPTNGTVGSSTVFYAPNGTSDHYFKIVRKTNGRTELFVNDSLVYVYDGIPANVPIKPFVHYVYTKAKISNLQLNGTAVTFTTNPIADSTVSASSDKTYYLAKHDLAGQFNYAKTKSGTIASIVEASTQGGVSNDIVLTSSAVHNLSLYDIIKIEGTVYYNYYWRVTRVISTTQVELTSPLPVANKVNYVADEATGTWSNKIQPKEVWYLNYTPAQLGIPTPSTQSVFRDFYSKTLYQKSALALNHNLGGANKYCTFASFPETWGDQAKTFNSAWTIAFAVYVRDIDPTATSMLIRDGRSGDNGRSIQLSRGTTAGKKRKWGVFMASRSELNATYRAISDYVINPFEYAYVCIRHIGYQNIEFYINGVLVSVAVNALTAPSTSYYPDGELFFGAYRATPVTTTRGLIGNVFYYGFCNDVALTANECIAISKGESLNLLEYLWKSENYSGSKYIQVAGTNTIDLNLNTGTGGYSATEIAGTAYVEAKSQLPPIRKALTIASNAKYVRVTDLQFTAVDHPTVIIGFALNSDRVFGLPEGGSGSGDHEILWHLLNAPNTRLIGKANTKSFFIGSSTFLPDNYSAGMVFDNHNFSKLTYLAQGRERVSNKQRLWCLNNHALAGTTTLILDFSTLYDLYIGYETGTAKALDGYVAFFAVWNRNLLYKEIVSIINNVPNTPTIQQQKGLELYIDFNNPYDDAGTLKFPDLSGKNRTIVATGYTNLATLQSNLVDIETLL